MAPEIIVAFQWAQPGELEDITALALRINDFLSGLLLGAGLRLIDFKIEFGRHYEGNTVQVILADEISPDCCRLWDTKTGEKMDKDRFRRDLGNVEEAYREVARRLGVLPSDTGESEPKVTKSQARKRPVMKLSAVKNKKKK